MNKTDDQFLSGVFSAMQYLVLMRDAEQFAAEIAKENGILRGWALSKSKKTGFKVRRMNKFIRRELRVS